MNKKQYVNVSFSKEFEKVNNDFLKCTVSLVTSEQIANSTRFTDKAIEVARYTLNYLPVIGWFKKNEDGEDDFSNHGIEYVINDDGIEEVCHTIPFGVIIPNSSRYEMLKADNGEEVKYLVADCYMWKRYDKAINVLKENQCNQSVEVEVLDCEYKSNYMEISEFTFSGVCVLSKDCQPAFNLAKIRTSDKFSKDEVKSCYSEMIEVLDNFLNFEGGENMDKEDYNREDEVEDDEEEFKKKKKCSEDEDEDSEQEEDFKKKKKCSEDEDEDSEDEEFKKKRKCAEDEDNEEEDEEFKKKKKCAEDEDEEEDEEFKKKRKCSSEEYEAKISELMEEYSTLSSEYYALIGKYNALESEVLELRAYKEEKEHEAKEIELEEEVFSKFEDLKQIEGYKDIYDARFELSKDDLTIRLKALAFDNGIVIGKKETKKFSKQSKKSLVVEPKQKNRVPSEWDSLIFRK